MQSLTITFIRHAESLANADPRNLICGQNVSVGLTSLGEQQALALGRSLSTCQFDDVYSSTAVRAQQTCQLALGREPDCSTSQLLEADAGDFTGLSRTTYDLPKIRAQLVADNWNFIPGFVIKGESQHQVADRMIKWVNDRLNQYNGNKKIVAFTHGLAIKYMMAELLNTDRSQAHLNRIDNTSITELTFIDRVLQPVIRSNDIGHLLLNDHIHSPSINNLACTMPSFCL